MRDATPTPKLPDEPRPEVWERATLPRAVARAARLWPDAVFIEDGDARITFAQLARAGDEAARAFIAVGVAPGERVAIWAPNIWEWAVAATGLQSVGALLAALNFRYKPREAAAALRRVGARWLCTLDENARAIAREDVQLNGVVCLRGGDGDDADADDANNARLISWENFLAAGAAVTDATLRARKDAVHATDIADLLFTSGSTGEPKAVMSSHGQNLRTFDAWSSGVGLRAGDRMLVIPPFSHSFGAKAGLLACLMRGATVLPQRSFDPAEILQRIALDRVSVWPGAPSMYQAVLALPERNAFDLSSLRLAVTGAAVVPVELVRRMRSELGFETVITAYGLTESTGCVSMCLPSDAPETIATTSGRALPGVEVRCVGSDGRVRPAGEPGEICVRGYNVMRGYWDAPEQSAQAVSADGWLHTGDIGVLDARGYLRITDRLKDMYIMNGFNVYPAEVEQQMFEHPSVAQVAVIGVPDKKVGEAGLAFVVPVPEHTLEPAALRAWCREHLADYKVPRHLRVVSALPMNATGKVDKPALRKKVADEFV